VIQPTAPSEQQNIRTTNPAELLDMIHHSRTNSSQAVKKLYQRSAQGTSNRELVGSRVGATVSFQNIL
jgi:hypothetical protein